MRQKFSKDWGVALEIGQDEEAMAKRSKRGLGQFGYLGEGGLPCDSMGL